MKYAIIGVEGPQDQAFVKKVLKLLKFKSFDGKESNLDNFWRKLIPRYPKKGNLYKRLDMPSIAFTETHSVAIYAGEGSNLTTNLDDILLNHTEYQTALTAFGVIADADKESPAEVTQNYSNYLKEHFSNFPDKPGMINSASTRTGIYILPDNKNSGVLDTLLCSCGEIAYPEFWERATSYLDRFSDDERKSLKWKPFAREKALVATVVSVLKPGKTNTASLADNNWVSQETRAKVSELNQFVKFIEDLLELNAN
ncbi:MAG: DUF3226 domain-containing protein [Cyanobacteriota bacterium]|nr:DUF3226 domain-containing protein [Cyanobacteriota bacterium]